jgi:hypothetical protein
MKNEMRVNKQRPTSSRVTVKTHWLEAVAGKWYENQDEVVKQTLKPYVCIK